MFQAWGPLKGLNQGRTWSYLYFTKNTLIIAWWMAKLKGKISLCYIKAAGVGGRCRIYLDGKFDKTTVDWERKELVNDSHWHGRWKWWWCWYIEKESRIWWRKIVKKFSGTSRKRWLLISVLVCLGFYNKIPQIRWLLNNTNLFLSVLEMEIWNWGASVVK